MDEERTRPGQWLGSVLCSFQCFDTDGWVSGRTSDRQKPNSTTLHRFSSRKCGGGRPEEEMADPDSPEKQPLNGSSGSSTDVI